MSGGGEGVELEWPCSCKGGKKTQSEHNRRRGTYESLEERDRILGSPDGNGVVERQTGEGEKGFGDEAAGGEGRSGRLRVKTVENLDGDA